MDCRWFHKAVWELVESFNEKYWFVWDWEEVWYSQWEVPNNFEFEQYYVFSLSEIYTCMYYDIDKVILMERYLLKTDKALRKKNKNISLKNFYLECKK